MHPYYQDNLVTLYHGDMRDVLPTLDMKFDACIADPPYEETSLPWDRWPDGWPEAAALVTRSLWCFGSLRMFMTQEREFAGWKMSQDVIWEKHNGTNPFNDRFRRVHEITAHFYTGEWADIYKSPQFTNDATARTVRRKARPTQWGDIGAASYASQDGGPQLMTSVIYVRSCHGTALHPTQKPGGILAPLIKYSVPQRGVLLDCFAGSGEGLITAKKLGFRAVGIELQKKYCALIVERLSQQSLDIVEADVCPK